MWAWILKSENVVRGLWKYFDWSSHWMLLVHWIGLIISNQPHSYGSEWPTGVIKCVQCDFFFLHKHIQLYRLEELWSLMWYKKTVFNSKANFKQWNKLIMKKSDFKCQM